jgi:hypothetical protein
MAGVTWQSLTVRVVSICLFAEGAATALWVAPRLGLIPTYGAVALIFVLGRAAMAVFQLTAGSLLWRHAHAGAVFAPFVFLASAALYVLEVGLRLRPSSVAPGARWPLLLGYSAYAVTCAVLIQRRRRQP